MQLASGFARNQELPFSIASTSAMTGRDAEMRDGVWHPCDTNRCVSHELFPGSLRAPRRADSTRAASLHSFIKRQVVGSRRKLGKTGIAEECLENERRPGHHSSGNSLADCLGFRTTPKSKISNEPACSAAHFHRTGAVHRAGSRSQRHVEIERPHHRGENGQDYRVGALPLGASRFVEVNMNIYYAGKTESDPSVDVDAASRSSVKSRR